MKAWKRYHLNRVKRTSKTNTSAKSTCRKWWQNQLTLTFTCQQVALQIYNIIKLLHEKKVLLVVDWLSNSLLLILRKNNKGFYVDLVMKRSIFGTTFSYCFKRLTLDVLRQCKRALFECNKHVSVKFLEFSENLKQSRYYQNFKLFSLVRNKKFATRSKNPILYPWIAI